MTVDTQDIELLEMYLDHELSDEEARTLDERLAGDASLQKALDRLRGHRALRLAAMSQSFDSDSAAVERLVASVRTERATEALAMRRRVVSPVRSIFAAAACVAFGLLLGVAIQRQSASGLVASPGGISTSSFLSSPSPGFDAHGTYVVSVGNGGQEVMKIRFHSQEQAQQFIERLNSQGGPTVNIGDATILEEPY